MANNGTSAIPATADDEVIWDAADTSTKGAGFEPDPEFASYQTDTISSSTYDMLEMRDVGVPQHARRRGAHAAPAAARTSQMSTYIVMVCVILLAVFSILGGILNVGDHLMAANGVLGWLFYLLILAAIVVGVIIPVIKVARRPVFSLYQLRDESGHARRRHCRMLADNLLANADLTPDEVIQVERCMEAGDEADDLLIDFFKQKCVPEIDAATKRAATTAFLTGAVSRSALVETVTMLSICLDLVRSIVEQCGFRPTNLALARIYSRVMISALIAGGIEDSDLSELMGNMLGGGAAGRASGIFLGGATSGLVSAFLVFRVGVITKRWLCAEDGPAQMAAIRRASYSEALTMMRTSGFMATVADALKRTASSVASSAGDAVVSAVRNTAQNATTAVANVAQGATTAMANAAQNATTAVVSVAQGATTAVTSAAQNATAAAASMAQEATSAITSAASVAGSAVSHVAGAAYDGMASMADSAVSAVTRGAAGVFDFMAHTAGAIAGGARSMRDAAAESIDRFLHGGRDSDNAKGVYELPDPQDDSVEQEFQEYQDQEFQEYQEYEDREYREQEYQKPQKQE